VREAIGLVVEGGEASHWAASVGHYYLFAVLYPIEVPAEVVLEVSHTDLDPRSSYGHGAIVATL
jgi:hypothetical protein